MRYMVDLIGQSENSQKPEQEVRHGVWIKFELKWRRESVLAEQCFQGIHWDKEKEKLATFLMNVFDCGC